MTLWRPCQSLLAARAAIYLTQRKNLFNIRLFFLDAIAYVFICLYRCVSISLTYDCLDTQNTRGCSRFNNANMLTDCLWHNAKVYFYKGFKPVSFSISNTHKIIFQPFAEELLASLVMAKGGGSAGGLAVDVLLTIVQIIVFLYDVISYPIYRFLSRALSQVTLLDILPNLTFCNNSTPLCWLLILTCHLVLKHTDFIKRIFSCYVQFIAITFKPTLAFDPDLSFQSAQHNNTGQCHNSRYGSML